MKGKVRKSLKASVFDGIFAAGMIGIMDSYLVPFALALQATASQISFLIGLPNLCASLAQSKIAEWTSKIGSRRRTVFFLITLQAFSLFLLPSLVFASHKVVIPALIAIAVLYTTSLSLAGPVWGSLMCEYLPLRRRNGYFGWRQRIMGSLTIVFTLAAGFVLNLFGKLSLLGFIAVFGVACLMRTISLLFVGRMHEPRFGLRPADKTPTDETSPTRPLANFYLFVGTMSFGAHLSSPYIAVYVLRNLQMSYLNYTLITIAASSIMFFMMAIWGRHADRSGNLKVIRLTSLVLPTLPLLWLISSDFYYLVILQMAGGLAWAGYNLCVGNYVYDAARSVNRVKVASRFHMINGFGIFLGGLTGGQLLPHLPALFGYKFLSLCVLSAIFRAIATFVFLPRVREVRPVEAISHKDLIYSVIGIRRVQSFSLQASRFLIRNITKP